MGGMIGSVIGIAMIILNIIGGVWFGIKKEHPFLYPLGYIILLVILGNINGYICMGVALIVALITLIAIIVAIPRKIEFNKSYKRNKEFANAVKASDIEAVKKLIKSGADVDFGGVYNAVMNNDAEMLSLLIENGANINISCGDMPLIFYVIKNDYKKLVSLLTEKGVHKQFFNYMDVKITPLYFAVMEKKEEMVLLLLEKGADVDEGMKGTMPGEAKKVRISPLCLATMNDDKEIISILVANGANINFEEGGTTPLTLAIDENRKDMVSFLIEKGADVNFTTSSGNTPLSSTILNMVVLISDAEPEKISNCVTGTFEDKKSIVELLVNNGAKIHGAEEQKQVDEWLELAVMKRRIDAAETFIFAGANVNYVSQNGSTPLSNAILDNAILDQNLEMIELLLKNGADIQKPIREYKNAIDYARNHLGSEKLVKLLENYKS